MEKCPVKFCSLYGSMKLDDTKITDFSKYSQCEDVSIIQYTRKRTQLDLSVTDVSALRTVESNY